MYLWLVLLFSLGFFILQGGFLVRDHMIYPSWNFIFLSGGIVLCGFAFLFVMAGSKLTYIAASCALVLSLLGVLPFHEVDRLFYGNLEQIKDTNKSASINEKIELCDHIKSYYLNLKPLMIADLEQTCSQVVIELSNKSKDELMRAFNWAYSEYARKRQGLQAEALACLYEGTDQGEFAAQISLKHQFTSESNRFKETGCRGVSANRGLASSAE